MQGSVKSAARVLRVFEYFAHQQRPATVTEIARTLAIPVSSTSVLLKSLMQMGYLEHDARAREYLPTVRFAVLGAWMMEQLFAEEEATPHLMDQLQRETRETIVLAMEHAPYVDYIRILQSIAPVRFHLAPGTRRPIWLVASGQALLAQWPDCKVEPMLRAANASGEHERVDTRAFLERLAEVREAGFAYTVGRATPDAAMLAMTLPVVGKRRPLAIAVCGPAERMERQKLEIVALMRDLIGIRQ